MDDRRGAVGDLHEAPIFTLDCPAFQVASASTAAMDLLGLTSFPTSAEHIFDPADLLRIRLVVEPLLRRNEEWTGQLALRAITNSDPVVLRVTCRAQELDDNNHCAIIEVTAVNPAARSPLFAGLAYRATHDPLTSLPNRALLRDRLDLSLARSRRQHRPTAVVLIDFDNFKAVNDTHGHAQGDSVLIGAAERMKLALRPSDTLARLGGDEFVAVCDDINDQRQAVSIAHRLLGALAMAPALDEPLKASLGVAISPDGRTTVDEILEHADYAMYEAKRLGGDQIVEFDATLAARSNSGTVESRPAPAGSATSGATTDESAPSIELRFEPVIDLRDGTTVSIEAHAHDGATGEPLGAAQPAGMLDQASDFAIELFGRLGDAAPTVLINVDRSAIVTSFTHIEKVLAQNLDLARDGVIIDLTDDVSRGLTRAQLGEIHDFRRAGVGVALSGFGQTTVSAGQLTAAAAQIVRIDAEVVAELGAEFDGRVVERIAEIVDVAAEAEVALFATGVTTPTQVNVLSQLGCLYAQGPLFGARLRPALIARFIDDPIPALRAED